MFYIIDAIGPFFKGIEAKTVNWSKIPFAALEENGRVNAARFAEIRKDFKVFIRKIADIGYNAISLDDLAHLANFDFYHEDLQIKIKQYQNEYQKLFHIAKKAGLSIFINTDIMFYNPAIHRIISRQDQKIINLLKQALEQIFSLFPVDGVITRIGEPDGLDVQDDFLSRVTVKTARQARKYLQDLLPVFERFNKKLIFRIWTIGAYQIGDLIWNQKTYDRVFSGLPNGNLIISLKYGQTDFFSHLKLNPLFFRGFHSKIIELQTRREREGHGLNPYYIGLNYESYFQELKSVPNLAGISVWCQTGGWSKWKDITFLDNSRVINELNTYASLKIFKGQLSANQAIASFFGRTDYIEFFKKYNRIFRELLYFKGFSDQEFYLRKLRLPPLLWVWWDTITVNPLGIFLHNFFRVKEHSVCQKNIAELLELGQKLGFSDIDFYCDTLRMLVFCREALASQRSLSQLKRLALLHQNRYPHSYHFKITEEDFQGKGLLNIFLRLMLRQKPQYRLIDRLLMNPFVSNVILILLYLNKKNLPSFVNRKAAPLSLLFK